MTKSPSEILIDWTAIGWAALESALFGALLGGAKRFAEELNRRPSPEEQAAELLGVSLDAEPDELRAALRRKLAETQAHPDHGGNTDEAARLIAARDLLLNVKRATASHHQGVV